MLKLIKKNLLQGFIKMEEFRTIPNLIDKLMHKTSDPIYQMMLNKQNQSINSNVNSTPQVIQYQNNDIKELEEFCMKNGIIGFNCGNMHPKMALKILKSKLGIPHVEEYNNTLNNKKIILG